MTATGVWALLAAMAGLQAGEPEAPAVQAGRVGIGYDAGAFELIDADIIDSEGYLVAHPDQRYRRLGADAQRRGRLDEARRHYRRAARYADKLAQGALAEMYWNGEGGERDRVLAYVWMDIAAERGAPVLLAHRERYWAQLDADERAQALREGPPLYAEFGDPAAKPRLERSLVTTRRRVTGSRVGWIGNLSICLEPWDGRCGAVVTGDQYYADRYWRPNRYWEWQDRILLTPPRDPGDVQVGPLEPLRRSGRDGDE